MRISRNLFHRKDLKKLKSVNATFIGSNAMNSIIESTDDFDKDEVLEVGDINIENRLTVDFCEGADYVGDIRAFFSNDYELTDSIAALKRRENSFAAVRMQHLLEHIQWTHQSACLSWAYGLLAEGGMIYIDTPNLEYIARMYVKNLERIENGLEVKFPVNEYPGMVKDVDKAGLHEGNFWKWINFKLYSGCSPGDFHHCSYDTYWLARLLNAAGFDRITVCARDTIRAVAYKSSSIDNDSVNLMLDEMFK